MSPPGSASASRRRYPLPGFSKVLRRVRLRTPGSLVLEATSPNTGSIPPVNRPDQPGVPGTGGLPPQLADREPSLVPTPVCHTAGTPDRDGLSYNAACNPAMPSSYRARACGTLSAHSDVGVGPSKHDA